MNEDTRLVGATYHNDAKTVARARALLGVSDTASFEEIKAAYEELQKPTAADDAAQRMLVAMIEFGAKPKAEAEAEGEAKAEAKAEGPHKRPRGRTPKGKRWDGKSGEWIDESSVGPGGIRKDDVPSPLGSNPAEGDSATSHAVESTAKPAVEAPTAAASTGAAAKRKVDVLECEAKRAGEAEDMAEEDEVEVFGERGVFEETKGVISEPLEDVVVGDGGCVAIALQKLKVFRTVKQAVEALDEARERHRSCVRKDQDCEAFLGVKGETWHIEIVKKAVIDEGYDFKMVKEKGKALLDSEKTMADGYFLVDGVVNDHY